MREVITPAGRGYIVDSYGGPPLDDYTLHTVELVDGRRVRVSEHYLDGEWDVQRIEDPPKGHPYRDSLTVRATPFTSPAQEKKS